MVYADQLADRIAMIIPNIKANGELYIEDDPEFRLYYSLKDREDTRTGEIVNLNFFKTLPDLKKMSKGGRTIEDVVNLIFRVILGFEMHEAQEHIYLDGKLMRDPHNPDNGPLEITAK